MASSLTKLKLIAAASYNPLKVVARSVVVCRHVAVVSTRLFSTKLGIQPDGSREFNLNLKNDGSDTTDVPDVINNVICPRLSATGNLFRLLYLMHARRNVCSSPWPIWDVMEDAGSLYLVRHMCALSSKYVKEFVTHSPTGLTKVYGTSLRVFHETPVPPAIEITVGWNKGYHSGAFYPRYMIKIDLPATFYRASSIEMHMRGEFLTISIPKKEEKWIESINLQIKFFSPKDNPIYYWSAPTKTKL